MLGVFNHYVVPHIRKEMPWLCFGAPLYNIALGREEEPSKIFCDLIKSTCTNFCNIFRISNCIRIYINTFNTFIVIFGVGTTKVTHFETFYQWSVFLERNLMYPLSFLVAFHHATPYLLCKFGEQ